MKTFHQIIKIFLLISLILYFVLLFVKPPLPGISDVADQVIKINPIQKEANIPPITAKYADYTYNIDPLYTYDIYGLVVAEYTSNNWLDITHKNDPANTRDICVVWGENISSGAYKKVNYKHGEFTCYYSFSRNINPPFNGFMLSNNHLIPKDKDIEKQIARVNIGDQIRISGYLANYSISDGNGKQISSRNTSTTREDSRNGACEIIYTDNIEIINKGNEIYYILKKILPFIILICSAYFVIRVIV